MSQGLRDLLFTMRQHPAFPELLKAVDAPEPKQFRARSDETADQQMADWIHRSGRKQQHTIWLDFLMNGDPPQGGSNGPSQQEKS